MRPSFVRHVLDAIEGLEAEMMIPAITSSQAGVWTAARRPGSDGVVPGLGRILDRACLPPPVG